MKKNIIYFLFFIIFTVVLGFLSWWMTQPNKLKQGVHSVIVQAVPVKVQSMPVVIQTIGTLEAAESVNILPQASGQITAINFEEGQPVQQGQLLMLIDPSEMQINLDKAKALLAKDQAQSATLSADSERFSKLVQKGYVSQQQYEQAVAANQAQQALVQSDQEQVEAAQTELDYTQIKAPITGRTGNLNVKVGDVVQAGGSDPLFTINQLDNLLVDFSVPQSELAEVQSYNQQQGPLTVELYPNPADKKFIDQAQLNFINNEVDPETGTVELKAELKNPNETLWPGQTLKVRLILTIQPNALVIPAQAVQIDQQGNFVFIDEGGKAKLIRVVVDRELDHMAVISSGLKPNDQVLTVIPPDLRDGMKIKLK